MEEDLLVCPYDPSHVIHPLRMPRHLLKCRKNHPALAMAVCPFNGYHEVPSQELRYHMTHCPDKALLDRDFELGLDLIEEGSHRRKLKGFTELPKASDDKLYCSDDELWDPSEIEGNTVFRGPGRNLQRSRRTHENSHLRLPNREGRALRLANTMSIFSDGNDKPSQSAANLSSSESVAPSSTRQGFQPRNRGNKQTMGRRCLHYDTDSTAETENYSTSEFDEPSCDISEDRRWKDPRFNVLTAKLCHSSPVSTPSSFTSSTNIEAHDKDSEKRHVNGVMMDASSTELSASSQRDIPMASNYKTGQNESKNRLAINSKTFLLGRGRGIFSPSEHQNVEGSGPGVCVGLVQGSVSSTPPAISSHSRSDRLSLLVQSLGRGRGTMLISNAAK